MGMVVGELKACVCVRGKSLGGAGRARRRETGRGCWLPPPRGGGRIWARGSFPPLEGKTALLLSPVLRAPSLLRRRSLAQTKARW